MKRTREQSGFALVEMVVSITLMLIVFGAVMGALEVFQRQSHNDQLRNEAQDNARTVIDRLSHELRNVASPSAGSAGALEKAGPYDLVFETVNPKTVFGGQNATNQMRVRYCLDASTPSNETLWREWQTWTSVAAPAMPDTSSCPGTAWGTNTYAVVRNVTNLNGGLNRALFAYGPAGAATTAQIRSVQVDLFVNPSPGNQPGETELTSGIFLRNSLAPPVASFAVSQVNGSVQLNGSGSTDPNGQTLSYQWFVDGSATGGTTQQYQFQPGAFASGSTHTFMLTVTNTGGLSNSASQVVTIN